MGARLLLIKRSKNSHIFTESSSHLDIIKNVLEENEPYFASISKKVGEAKEILNNRKNNNLITNHKKQNDANMVDDIDNRKKIDTEIEIAGKETIQTEIENITTLAFNSNSDAKPKMQLKTFPCYMCEHMFQDIHEMMEHLIDDHNIAPKSKKSCITKIDNLEDNKNDEILTSETELRKNIDLVPNEPTLIDNEAKHNDQDLVSYEENQIDSSDTESFDEEEFYRIYDNVCNLLNENGNEHMKIENVDLQTCQKCNEVFTNSFLLDVHEILDHQEEQLFACMLCCSLLKSQHELDSHNNNEHPD